MDIPPVKTGQQLYISILFFPLYIQYIIFFRYTYSILFFQHLGTGWCVSVS